MYKSMKSNSARGRANLKLKLCSIMCIRPKYTTFTYIFQYQINCLRPYHVECTGSRPITEVKQHWAWLVLGWVTAWEHQVL